MSLSRLQLALAARSRQAESLSTAMDLKPLLAILLRQAGGMGAGAVAEGPQQKALSEFWDSKKIETFKGARLVAFGFAVPVKAPGLCIMEDSERFECAMRDIARWNSRPSLFRRCYQGLLASYFAYDSNENSTGKSNWVALRDHLGARSQQLADTKVIPPWVEKVRKHPELFTPNPCDVLGRLDLEGKDDYLAELRSQLLISNSSWFSRELFFGRLRAACAVPDEAFVARLPGLLRAIGENLVYHDRGLGMVLDRYAASKTLPMRRDLRDHAVSKWGNPWLSRNSSMWGQVSADTRALLSEWLKLEFIESFFTLLAEDGQSDPRRMNFWKRYVHEIDDIRFALGSEARDSRKKDFVELRNKAKGLTLTLSDGAPQNNAFIMKMKGHVLVEFSGKGNASYVYKGGDDLPFDVHRPVCSTVNAENSLKNRSRKMKLTHQDGIHGFTRWEPRFEFVLQNECGITHSGPRSQLKATRRAHSLDQRAETAPAAISNKRTSSSAPHLVVRVTEGANAPSKIQKRRDWSNVKFSDATLAEFCNDFNLSIDDRTSKGGNLWVRNSEVGYEVAAVLRQWGFRLKGDAGWWRS